MFNVIKKPFCSYICSKFDKLSMAMPNFCYAVALASNLLVFWRHNLLEWCPVWACIAPEFRLELSGSGSFYIVLPGYIHNEQVKNKKIRKKRKQQNMIAYSVVVPQWIHTIRGTTHFGFSEKLGFLPDRSFEIQNSGQNFLK